MAESLKITIILFVIILYIIILNLIRKKKIPVKYSLVWFLFGFIILIVAIFTKSMSNVSNFLGFEVLSNMLIFVLIGLLIFVTMFLTVVISKQKEQIKTLIQEISILKVKVNKEK